AGGGPLPGEGAEAGRGVAGRARVLLVRDLTGDDGERADLDAAGEVGVGVGGLGDAGVAGVALAEVAIGGRWAELDVEAGGVQAPGVTAEGAFVDVDAGVGAGIEGVARLALRAEGVARGVAGDDAGAAQD